MADVTIVYIRALALAGVEIDLAAIQTQFASAIFEKKIPMYLNNYGDIIIMEMMIIIIIIIIITMIIIIIIIITIKIIIIIIITIFNEPNLTYKVLSL